MKVYMSGPITGISWGNATDWRDWAKVELAKHDIDGYSPLRGKQYLAGEESIAKFYSTFPMSTPKGITTRDRYDSHNCDLMLVNFVGATKISVGTVMEVAWADSFRIPVIAAMEPGNIHEHPILNECCGLIVPTLEEAVTLVIRFLLP